MPDKITYFSKTRNFFFSNSHLYCSEYIGKWKSTEGGGARLVGVVVTDLITVLIIGFAKPPRLTITVTCSN